MWARFSDDTLCFPRTLEPVPYAKWSTTEVDLSACYDAMRRAFDIAFPQRTEGWAEVISLWNGKVVVLRDTLTGKWDFVWARYRDLPPDLLAGERDRAPGGEVATIDELVEVHRSYAEEPTFADEHARLTSA